MANPIEIIITGTDKASDAIKDVTGSLGGLASFAGGALTLGLAAATAAIGALGVGLGISLKEAMDAEVVQARLAAVIKSTGGAAGVTSEFASDLAMKLRDLAGGSDDAVKGAEAVLLRFQNIGRETFPQATETSLDLAAALGIDAPAAALLLGKALEAPGEGLMRLKAAGVVFKKEQIEEIKAMAEAGDAAGAQKMILDALTESVGGTAKALGETLSGKLAIIKGHFLEIAENIGNKLLPILEPLATKFMGAVDAIAGRIQPFLNLISTGADPLEAFKAMFVSLLPPELQGQVNGVIDALGRLLTVASGIGEAIRTIVTGDFRGGIFGLMEDDPVITALLKVHDLIATDIPNALAGLSGVTLTDLIPPSIMDGITNLAAALQTSGPQIQESGAQVSAALADAGAKIKVAWDSVVAIAGPELVANISSTLNSMAELWRAHGDQVIAALGSITSFMSGTFGTGISVAIGLIGGWLTILSGMFAAALQIIQGDWQGGFETMGTSMKAAIDTILASLGTSMTEIVTLVNLKMGELKLFILGKTIEIISALLAKATEFKNAGVAWIQGLIDGIGSMITKLIAAAVGAVMAAINAAKIAAGIGSPSVVFAGMGQQMMAGMALGIQQRAYMPAMAAAGAVGGAVSNAYHSVGTLNMNVSGAGDPGAVSARVIRDLQDRDLIRR